MGHYKKLLKQKKTGWAKYKKVGRLKNEWANKMGDSNLILRGPVPGRPTYSAGTVLVVILI